MVQRVLFVHAIASKNRRIMPGRLRCREQHGPDTFSPSERNVTLRRDHSPTRHSVSKTQDRSTPADDPQRRDRASSWPSSSIVVGYGLFRATAIDVTGDFVEGTQYKMIDGAAPIPTTGPIRVTEFFSYGCIHCRNFDPMVERMAAQRAKGVLFERSPVCFSPDVGVAGAQAYYALQAQMRSGKTTSASSAPFTINGKQFVRPRGRRRFRRTATASPAMRF